jgi:AbrB family looped-hinge helix DNA binding protein
MATNVTSKGQVTIPKRVRDLLGLVPGSAVDFEVSSQGQVTLRRAGRQSKRRQSRFEKLRGIATIRMTTEEILALTRGG